MAIDSHVQVLLAARSGTYQVLQNLFGNEPSEETLEQLARETTQEVLSLFKDESEIYDQTLKTLIAFVSKGLLSINTSVDTLNDGFTHLFVGPGKVEADPWESIYRSNGAVLFQSSTLEVRKAYVAQGFIPNSYPHVADDHIALELDFMAALGAKLAESFDEGDTEATVRYLKASEEFLHGHLLQWVPAFAAALESARHNYFYKEAGALLNEFIKIDAGALEEIKSYLES